MNEKRREFPHYQHGTLKAHTSIILATQAGHDDHNHNLVGRIKLD